MDKNKLAAYQKIQRTTGSPRETEALALTLGASKLMHCQDNWESEERTELLGDALKFNQKLWTIFQASVAGSESPLPKSLRLKLLRLSSFIDKQIFTIMAYPSPEKLTPIININLSIAAGLRAKAAPLSSGEMSAGETPTLGSMKA